MKMKIVYRPDAADRREWVVDRNNPAWDVSYGVEQATDWGWIEFLKRFDGFSPSAWRAIIWALRKRDEAEARLRLEAVQIDWAEVNWSLQCPRCETWIPVADVATATHKCPLAPADEDAPGDDEITEKAGDSDPEA